MIYERYSKRMHEKLQNANKQYSNLIFKKVGSLSDVEAFCTKEHLRSVPQKGYTPLLPGAKWGGEWQNMWIRGNAVVSAEAAGRRFYAVPKTGAVEILYFKEGKPSGLFNSKNDFIGGWHSAQLITDNGREGEVFSLAFECYAGHFCAGTSPYDNYGKTEAGPHDFERLYESIDLCVMEDEIKDFVFDLKALLQMIESLPANNFLRGKAQNAAEKVFANLIQFPLHYEREEWKKSLDVCSDIMSEVFIPTGAEKTRGKVGLIGHSHMDTAWLWPVSETIRKCARTYSNALSLMEQYPEYRFIQSSALHLDWMRRYYPKIFEGIKEMTKIRRYEPNGGVWVECDCNITSGESMVRQFMKGQHFTRKYLNYTSDCFWLPDTFGYNGAIPQIMRECDVKYFYTTKISWNDLNAFPLDTFIWKGIDGSSVLTHFNIMHTFPDIQNTTRAVNEIKDKQVYDGRLLAFGFGDGGGGPTFGMLEDARRCDDIAGLPDVNHTTVSEFMQNIEKDAVNLPVYSGELYLELHRGTLTQMHDIKRNNRKAEFALHDMEVLNVLADEPKNEKSDELLETLLLNQFHDILPGTCITPVNELARKEITGVINNAKQETAKYAAKLIKESSDITVFNTLSFDRSDIIYLENVKGAVSGASNQSFIDITGREILAVGGIQVPAYSAKTLELTGTAEESSQFEFDGTTLNTPCSTVVFDKNGAISSFIDKKSKRELRRPGGEPLNTFYIAEDVPQMYDNWDIDSDLSLKTIPQRHLIKREVVSNGSLQFRLRSVYSIGKKTTLCQDMIFYSDSPRIDFHTVIDWKEKHTFLKVGFDVDLSVSFAKNEIQFGHIDRPTTRNNSLEASKFEVCNYKWTDISESRFGIAILNDCKYGISIENSDIRLSLHKGGCHPDVSGDEGIHEMLYTFLPHEGQMSSENVIKPSYTLNVPHFFIKGSLKESVKPIIKVNAENIICETLKPAELVKNAYIARLYECERNKTECEIEIGSNIKRVYLTNMLEDIKEELPINNGKVFLTFNPFKIITLLLEK